MTAHAIQDASSTPFATLAAMLEDAANSIDRDIGFALDRIVAVRDMLLGRQSQATPQPESGGLAPWQARQVTAYVDAHLDETIANDDLAAVARLSTGHFCRAFRQTFGTTPHAFVMQRRVDNASMMMIRSSEPLAIIAAACGFTDQAHLSRIFRRLNGDSPATWRRQYAARPLALAA